MTQKQLLEEEGYYLQYQVAHFLYFIFNTREYFAL